MKNEVDQKKKINAQHYLLIFVKYLNFFDAMFNVQVSGVCLQYKCIKLRGEKLKIRQSFILLQIQFCTKL